MKPGCAVRERYAGCCIRRDAGAIFCLVGLLLGAAITIHGQPAAQILQDRVLQPPVELRNLGILKDELRQYHDCTGSFGCYTQDLEAQTERAQAALAARVVARRPGEKLSIVFDIDETVLSNWPELKANDFGFNLKADDAWERSEQAEAIPGSVALYKQAVAAGVAVFFITGRKEEMREVTAINLNQRGMTEWTSLVLRNASEEKETAQVYKSSERRKIVEQGYTLIMSIGDQWSDLDGEPRAETSVKLPNPFYFIP